MKQEIDEASITRAKTKIMVRTLLDFAKEFYLKPENKAKFKKWKEEREKETK